MDDPFEINDVVRLLGVSASMLRYWESKGLFTVKKGQNSYRQYTMEDLVRIADIIFYRSIEIPIEKIKKFDNYSLEMYHSEFIEQEILLKQKMELLSNISEKIHKKRRI